MGNRGLRDVTSTVRIENSARQPDAARRIIAAMPRPTAVPVTAVPVTEFQRPARRHSRPGSVPLSPIRPVPVTPTPGIPLKSAGPSGTTAMERRPPVRPTIHPEEEAPTAPAMCLRVTSSLQAELRLRRRPRGQPEYLRSPNSRAGRWVPSSRRGQGHSRAIQQSPGFPKGKGRPPGPNSHRHGRGRGTGSTSPSPWLPSRVRSANGRHHAPSRG